MRESPTPEQLAHGGIVYNEGVYRRGYTFFIDMLRDKDFINDSQYHAGIRIIALQRRVVKGVDYAVQGDRGGAELSPICPTVLFARTMRQLKPMQGRLVNAACWPITWGSAFAWLTPKIHELAEAMESLQNALDEQENLLYDVEMRRGEVCPESAMM